jgi:hypothetical protein
LIHYSTVRHFFCRGAVREEQIRKKDTHSYTLTLFLINACACLSGKQKSFRIYKVCTAPFLHPLHRIHRAPVFSGYSSRFNLLR